MAKTKNLLAEKAIKNLIEIILNKKFPKISIVNFQAIPTHNFIPELNEWVSNNDYCVYLILRNEETDGIFNLREIETELSDLTGYEICASR